MRNLLQLVNAVRRRVANYSPISGLAVDADDAALFIAAEIRLIHASICTDLNWDFLRKESELLLFPTLTGAAIDAATAGDTTINFTSANPFTDTRAIGAFIRIRETGSSNHVYRITDVSDQDTCTIEPALIDTVTSAAVADVFQEGYLLPADFNAPLTEANTLIQERMQGLDLDRFVRSRVYESEFKPDFFAASEPCLATIWGLDISVDQVAASAPLRRFLLIGPPPTYNETIPFDYFTIGNDLVADADVPSIPEAHEEILLSWAMFAFFVDFRPDPQKAALHAKAFEAGYQAMTAAFRMTTDNAAIVPASDRSHWSS